MIVISKIDIIHKLKILYSVEQWEKQVFHEFDKCATSSKKFEIHKLHKNADVDFNIIATDAEMKICVENKPQIK